MAMRLQRGTRLEQEISRRARLAREEAGLSQADVSKLLGMERSGYGHYERGRLAWRIDILEQLSQILGKPLEYFLGIDTELSEDEAELVHMYRGLSERSKRVIRDFTHSSPNPHYTHYIQCLAWNEYPISRSAHHHHQRACAVRVQSASL